MKNHGFYGSCTKGRITKGRMTKGRMTKGKNNQKVERSKGRTCKR